MLNDKEPNTSQPNWEYSILEKIALEGIKEQRRARRWNLFFKFILLAYFIVILFIMFNRGNTDSIPEVDLLGQETEQLNTEGSIAVIRLSGLISANEEASAENLNRQLSKAFMDSNTKGVMILANSPGGSPVQSSLVHNHIMMLKEKYKLPIITVVTDMCASGCYFITAATDKIFANVSSIVGSIGVISPNYGVVDTMEMLGIQNRTMTAGKYKNMLDPTKPIVDSERAHFQHLLDTLHTHFIDAIKSGRGNRLADNDDLFTGLFWTGDEAVKLGLIDGLKSPIEATQTIGNYRLVDMTPVNPVKNMLKNFGVVAKQTATSTVKAIKADANELILK